MLMVSASGTAVKLKCSSAGCGDELSCCATGRAAAGGEGCPAPLAHPAPFPGQAQDARTVGPSAPQLGKMTGEAV